MTEDEALARWKREIDPREHDPESQHGAADELVVEALRAVGWNRLADKWVKASDEWWWA